MPLPYDMGNAGDLLKHGVLAEFVRWRCDQGGLFRFIDLFGGELCNQPASGDEIAKRARMVAKRVRSLLPPNTALRTAQTGIEKDCYYGSGLLVKKMAEKAGKRDVRVLVNDSCQARRKRFEISDLSLLDEEFPGIGPDAYEAFEDIVCQDKLQDHDLVLIDPFNDLLKEKKYRKVIPQMAKAAERAAVLLFALNLKPCNKTGREFDTFLKEHLPKAWRMIMPPLRHSGIEGESKYHAEVVLAACALEDETEPKVSVLRERLEKLAAHLAALPARQLKPQAVREATWHRPFPSAALLNPLADKGAGSGDSGFQ